MKYKVIKAFTDSQDNAHVYSVGDSYPRSGTASTERAAALSSTDNSKGVPFIQSVEGEKVKSKKKAVKAEKALTE